MGFTDHFLVFKSGSSSVRELEAGPQVAQAPEPGGRCGRLQRRLWKALGLAEMCSVQADVITRLSPSL